MNRNDIDLNLLPAFDALLQEQSVTKAAARLGLSAPALSHALSRLRTKLGDPLLVRAGRTMVPSPLAQRLRPRVHALLQEVRDVLAPADGFDARTSDREFSVHGSDYVIMVLGTALDEVLRREGPNVRLQFMPNSDADPALVRDGELDLAIGVYGKLHPEIRIQRLFEEELVCVVREGHPRVGKRISLRQYAALPHIQIAPRGRPGGKVDELLAERGLPRTVVRRVPFFYAGLAMAAHTDYVLTLPKRLAYAYAGELGLRILALPLSMGKYAMSQIWHPRHEGDQGHRWLRERIVAASMNTRPARR